MLKTEERKNEADPYAFTDPPYFIAFSRISPPGDRKGRPYSPGADCRAIRESPLRAAAQFSDFSKGKR